jgi:L,D-transpeptidase YcbB
MLREIDCGRPAPHRGLAAAWLSIPVLIAAALPAHAGDWSANIRSIGQSIRGEPAARDAVVSTAASPMPADIDVQLPPYPPPISGLDGGLPAAPGKVPSSAVAPKAVEPSVGALVPPPLPTEPLPTEPLPTEPLPTELVPPPLPPPVVADDHTPEIMRAAFAKASEGALFPRLLKPERLAITTYYDAHGFKPLWHSQGATTPAGLALLDRLAHAAEEGLDPDDYAAAATPAASARPEDVAEAEWRISAAMLAYARDARGARINPVRLSTLITPQLTLPNAEQVFEMLTRAADASTALQAFNPHADGYVNLRTALAKLRAEMVAPSPAKIEDAAAAQLASVAPETVKGRAGTAAGQAAKRAVSALSPKRIETDIVANMERWRWLPPDLGDRYILVNVPEFTLRYVNNGKVAHEARVIVGKPTSPTPIFSGDMKFLVVNPSWYIPPSILKKEFLPKLAEDPLYAERQGYVVVRHGGQISIRQPPGERNALGRIKFMFPNQHSVYLHDTPARGLFAKAERAFSHGCVRVDQPFKLAEYVLNDKSAWPETRIEKMIGGAERTINLQRQLAVHLAYFTLTAGVDGTLHRIGDLYGLDPRLEAMLSPRK